MLPTLAKKVTDTLIAECQDAQYKLEVIPTSTIEFVDSLTFLDVIQERVSNSDDNDPTQINEADNNTN